MDQLRIHKLDSKTLQKKKVECQKYIKPNKPIMVQGNGGPSLCVYGTGMLENY